MQRGRGTLQFPIFLFNLTDGVSNNHHVVRFDWKILVDRVCAYGIPSSPNSTNVPFWANFDQQGKCFNETWGVLMILFIFSVERVDGWKDLQHKMVCHDTQKSECSEVYHDYVNERS